MLGNRDVLIPQKVIFLPNTAQRRQVHFFPSEMGNLKARVIIGSERARGRRHDLVFSKGKFSGIEDDEIACATDNVFGLHGTRCPPIGCYLDEADLGSWIKSDKLSEMPTDVGIGRLDRRLERFNPDDDCDLEAYIF